MTDHLPPPTVEAPNEASQPTLVRRAGGRLRVIGSALVVIGTLASGFYAGWSYRDRTADSSVIVEPKVTVDRPVVLEDAPDARVGRMPNVTGLPLEQARQAISDAGIRLETVTEVATPYAGAGGTIVTQAPSAGTDRPASITLTYSQATAVPEMVGADVDDVRAILGELGVRVNASERYVAGTPEGTVLASDPPAGEPLSTELTLDVAEAASSVFLADLRATTSSCGSSDLAVNGTNYFNALVCEPAYDDRDEIEYILNRSIDEFSVVAGLADRSATDAPMQFEVLVDGAVVASATVGYGRTETFVVPVAGALRLTLRVRRADTPDRCCDVDAVWADARVSGGQSAVDALVVESNS